MKNNPSRRSFLKAATLSAAAGAMATPPVAEAAAASSVSQRSNAVVYPTIGLVTSASMEKHKPIGFNYPDAASPCVAIRMDKRVPGGVGPDGTIVAFSILCSHMGCPVDFDANAKTFKCPCHYSIFDPEHGGQMVCGQATANLTQIELHYDAKTDGVSAIGVSGLIYGRLSNVF